jgi:hypothetical protein
MTAKMGDHPDTGSTFLHLSDGEGKCIELPSHYLDRPDFIFRLADRIEGFFTFEHTAPLWRDAVAQALSAHAGSNSSALVEQIRLAPRMLYEVAEVRELIVCELRDQDLPLLSALAKVKKTGATAATIETYLRFETLTRADLVANAGGMPFVIDKVERRSRGGDHAATDHYNGVAEADTAVSDDDIAAFVDEIARRPGSGGRDAPHNRFIDIATANTRCEDTGAADRGGDTGAAEQGGEYGKVKAAVSKRAKDTGAAERSGEYGKVKAAVSKRAKDTVIAPVALVRCEMHAREAAVHRGIASVGPWGDPLHPVIPTLEELLAKPVLAIEKIP